MLKERKFGLKLGGQDQGSTPALFWDVMMWKCLGPDTLKWFLRLSKVRYFLSFCSRCRNWEGNTKLMLKIVIIKILEVDAMFLSLSLTKHIQVSSRVKFSENGDSVKAMNVSFRLYKFLLIYWTIKTNLFEMAFYFL